jgi:RNA polymerase sigma factor (sigma-70 family)
LEEYIEPSKLSQLLEWAISTGNVELALRVGAKLCEEYRPKLQSYIRNKAIPATIDREEAIQDILMETVTRALEAIRDERYTTTDKGFLAWLKGIAGNCMKELGRQREVLERLVGPGSDNDDDDENTMSLIELLTAEPDDLVESLVIDREQNAKLNEALKKLPLESQFVLSRRVDGYTNKKIAQELGKTEEAIESRYSRSIKKLKVLLSEQIETKIQTGASSGGR